MLVCCECCVLSGRGLCDELITRPEGSYRLWWVVVCDLETSRIRRSWPALGRSATENVKQTDKETPNYAISSRPLFNSPSQAETYPSVPHSKTLSACVPPHSKRAFLYKMSTACYVLVKIISD
jgi:hypothetical protein